MENKKILIIDDDKKLTDMYSSKFNASGFQTTVARNAQEAKKLFEERLKPEIILLDIVMPGQNGVEFLNEIRKNNLGGNPPIMMLTNLDQSEDLNEGIMEKIDGYFVKTEVTPGIMVAKVNELLEKRKK